MGIVTLGTHIRFIWPNGSIPLDSVNHTWRYTTTSQSIAGRNNTTVAARYLNPQPSTCRFVVNASELLIERDPDKAVRFAKMTSFRIKLQVQSTYRTSKARCSPTTGRARNPIANAPLTVSYKSPNGPSPAQLKASSLQHGVVLSRNAGRDVLPTLLEERENVGRQMDEEGNETVLV
jgi:hypothetical protein